MPKREPSKTDIELAPKLVSAAPTGTPTGTPTQSASVFYAEMFAGPLPHPSILAEYEKVYPGAATIIVAMAQAQSLHRQGIENKVVDAEIVKSKLGMVCGAGVAALGIGCGTYAAASDHQTFGIAVASTTLVTIVGMFLKANSDRKEERVKKAKVMAGQNPDGHDSKSDAIPHK